MCKVILAARLQTTCMLNMATWILDFLDSRLPAFLLDFRLPVFLAAGSQTTCTVQYFLLPWFHLPGWYFLLPGIQNFWITNQGWDFTHQILELIACFLPKKWANKRFAQEVSDSLIPSFLVSNLSNLLTIPHSVWVTWTNRSQLLICPERPEPITSLRRLERIFCFF